MLSVGSCRRLLSVLKGGADAAGLSRYLFGAGKANEHENQHLVAGSGSLAMEFGGELSLEEATLLGRLVEGSWREQYVEQLALVGASQGGISRAQTHRDGVVATGRSHVFHASMALHPDDPALTDAQWAELASEYVDRMGFTQGGPGVASSWYAARHGLSEKGNDHIHIVVNLVRDDGHWSSEHQSKNKARALEAEFENSHEYLVASADRVAGQQRGLPAYTVAEQRRGREREAAGIGPAVPDRVHLQRAVRGAAEAASTEAEFVHAVLESGIDIEPRWQAGGRDVVTGYTVQIGHPGADKGADQQVRFGAKRLASDLTLTKLRTRWADNESDATRAQALSLWRGEVPMRRPQPPANVRAELEQAAHHLEAFNQHLAGIDPSDRAAWKREAAHAAGTFSLLAARESGQVGAELGVAADGLTRVSLPDRDPPDQPVAPASGASSAQLAARHMNLALRAGSLDSSRGWMAVLNQLGRTSHAIQDAHQARAELVAANRLLAGVSPAMATATGRIDAHSLSDAAETSVRDSRGLFDGSRQPRPGQPTVEHQRSPSRGFGRDRGRDTGQDLGR